MRRGLVLGALGGAVWLALPTDAQASVTGRHGVEIEGPRDRRGFYVGPAIGAGATFFATEQDDGNVDVDFVPNLRLDLHMGGGITKRFLLGLDLAFIPYLAKDQGVSFGGDILATGYLFRGLFLRAGLGAAGVPAARGEKGIAAGIGGQAGIGYEFFLNQTVALGFSANYDLRFVPGDKVPRNGAFLGLQFTWF